MSASVLPYRLRPHKAVDRRLFMELLVRFERWQDLHDHVYVSMASYTMEDQKLVHRLLGISRLLAFDRDDNVRSRQHFNRPIGEAKCIACTANELTADIETTVRNAEIEDPNGYVVWLDYTDPRKIGEQLREFQSLAAQMAVGDVLRVTVSAHWPWWAEARDREGKQLTVEERQVIGLEKLKRLIGDYLPVDFAATDLSEKGIAQALSTAFAAAADRAKPPQGDETVVPLSVVRYADGMQMLSITVAICPDGDRAALRNAMGLQHWHFASDDWQDVKYLAVPDLTVRERLYLEQHINDTNQAISEAIGFDLDAATESPGFLDNFRDYYRHYPALSPVEL